MARWKWWAGISLIVLGMGWRRVWPPLRAWLERYDHPSWVAPVDLDGDGVDEAVVFYSGRGVPDRAVAWDIRSGEPRWEALLPGYASAGMRWGAADGVFFVTVSGDDKAMLGLDPATGELLWTTVVPDSAIRSVGCGGRIFLWGPILFTIDARTGVATGVPPVNDGASPSVVCGEDGALVLGDSLGGPTERYDRAGRSVGPSAPADLVYTQDGATRAIVATGARWVEGTPGRDPMDPPRANENTTWVRPDGSFVNLSGSNLYACDAAVPRVCTPGAVDSRLDWGGMLPMQRGRDGAISDPVAHHRFVPAGCTGGGGAPLPRRGACVLDLDRLAVAAGPVADVEFDYFASARNAGAIGEDLVVLPLREPLALAVFDTRDGRFTRVVVPGDAAGRRAEARNLTVGRTAVFGQASLGGEEHVFAFDPVTGAIPWSMPPGVVAVELPEILARLPAAP